MNKKAYLMKPALLLSASAALLLLSTVGSTRAALTYYSENYAVEVTVSSIGVSLLENGETVSSRNYDGSQWKESTGELLTGMLKEGEAIVPGRPYEESLSVANSGAIDSYVRVNLYRSWQDANGETDTMLSPELIDLSLNLEGAAGWRIPVPLHRSGWCSIIRSPSCPGRLHRRFVMHCGSIRWWRPR